MGLFSFTQEIAMDLGTANTIIIRMVRSLSTNRLLLRWIEEPTAQSPLVKKLV